MDGYGWLCVVMGSYRSLWMTAGSYRGCGWLNMTMYGYKYIHTYEH